MRHRGTQHEVEARKGLHRALMALCLRQGLGSAWAHGLGQGRGRAWANRKGQREDIDARWMRVQPYCTGPGSLCKPCRAPATPELRRKRWQPKTPPKVAALTQSRGWALSCSLPPLWPGRPTAGWPAGCRGWHRHRPPGLQAVRDGRWAVWGTGWLPAGAGLRRARDQALGSSQGGQLLDARADDIPLGKVSWGSLEVWGWGWGGWVGG